MSTDIIDTPIEVVSRLAHVAKNMTTSSLSEYTKVTRISPVVIVEDSIGNYDPFVVTNILQTMLSIYTGMYLTAINLSMTVGDIRVMRFLDSFATDRDILTSASHSHWLDRESYSTESLRLGDKFDDLDIDSPDHPNNMEFNDVDVEKYDNGKWFPTRVFIPITKTDITRKRILRTDKYVGTNLMTTKENCLDYINSTDDYKDMYIGFAEVKVRDVKEGYLMFIGWSIPLNTGLWDGHRIIQVYGEINIPMAEADVNVTMLKDGVEVKPNKLSKEKFYMKHTSLPSCEASTGDDVLDNIAGVGLKGANADKGVHDKTILEMHTPSNLAVGKMIEVKFCSEGKTISIPIAVTMFPRGMSGQDFVKVVGSNVVDRSISGRWYQWRSGEIKFIQDALLCLDLLKADRDALKADKDGVLLAARSKRTVGIGAALLSGYASPNTISSMAVISKNTAKQIEYAMKRRLTDPKTRQIFFENNSLMLLVVVDTDMERLTFYYRGIAEQSDYTFTDIKDNGKKSSAPDIEGILKAYKIGNAPSF